MLTIDVLQRALPAKDQKKVTQGVVDKMNAALTDPELVEEMKENILGYISVIRTGRIKISDYLNAVKYVTYKLMGDSNVSAWSKTFPARYSRLKAKNTPEKDIHSHVSLYNKNKIVNEIYDMAQVPTHILNADVFQKAINVQASLMNDPMVSPKVRCEAANSLLTHLKKPEAKKVELDVSVKDDSMVRELKDITLNLAAQQKQMIESGAYTSKEIAHQKIIQGERVDN